MTTDDLAVPFRARVGQGMRPPANWLELVRFTSAFLVALTAATPRSFLGDKLGSFAR